MHPCASIVQRLPQHVVERSRSNTQILDFPCAVSELVLNSIQAGSKGIQVVVSVSQWSVSVEDDGCGISATSMQLLGQRFCSSSSTGRGESLSSLAHVSELQVTTRATGSFETYTKTISCHQNSQVASGRITLCIIPRQRCGTTVSLSKFLHNQPVRLRQTKGHAAVLEGIKVALHDLLLPHTTVELTLRQEGSSNPLLHMDKGRSLSQALQQYFSQHADHLHSTGTQHRQGWQLSGAAVAPPAVFTSREQQLLYINNQQVTCVVLTQLLRDWYLKSLRTLQASDKNSSGSRMTARTPEPGYVLLLSCPTAAVDVVGRVAGKLDIEFSSSMGQLYTVLQEGLGAVWGSMPSVWLASARKDTSSDLEARAGTASAVIRHPAASGRASKRRYSNQYQQQQEDQQKQQVVLPVHGLQMSSKSRSLAGMQAYLNPAEDPTHKLPGTKLSTNSQEQQHGASDMLNTDLADALADDDDALDLLLAGKTHPAAATQETATAFAPHSNTGSLWGHQGTGLLDEQHQKCGAGSGRSRQSAAAAALAGMKNPELGNREYGRCWLGSGGDRGLSRGRKHWTAAAAAVGSAGRSGGSGSAGGACAVADAAGAHHGSVRGNRHRAATAGACPAGAAADLSVFEAATTDADAAWLEDRTLLVEINTAKPAWHSIEAAARDHPAPADGSFQVADWDSDLPGHSTVYHAQVKGNHSHRAGSAAVAEAATGTVFDEVQVDLDMLDVSPLPINSDRWQQHQQRLQQHDADLPLATASTHWLDSSMSPGICRPAMQQHRELRGSFKAEDERDPIILSPLQDATARQSLEQRQHHAAQLAADTEDLALADMLQFSVSPVADPASPLMQHHSMKFLEEQQRQQQCHLGPANGQELDSRLVLDFEVTPLGGASDSSQQQQQSGFERDKSRQSSEQLHGLLENYDGYGRECKDGMPYDQYDVTPGTRHSPLATNPISGINFQDFERHLGADAEGRLLSKYQGFLTGHDLSLNSSSLLRGACMSNAAGLAEELDYDGHQQQCRQPWLHQQDDSLDADIYLQTTHTWHQQPQQQQTLTADEDMLSLPSLWQPTASAQQAELQHAPTYSCGSNLQGSNMPGQQKQRQTDQGLSSPQLLQHSPWPRSAVRAADRPLSPSLGAFMGELQTMMNDPVDPAVAAAAAGRDGGTSNVGHCEVVDTQHIHATLPGHEVLLELAAAAGDGLAAHMVPKSAAAPAESEETVQQHRRQQQQVQSRPHCMSPDKQQGSSAAALADAASALLPGQQLPLLPVFQERLVHSAPPETKRRRVLARSGCYLLGGSTKGSVSSIKSRSNSRVVKRLMVDTDAAAAVDDPAVSVPGSSAQEGAPAVGTAACTGSASAGAADRAADCARRRRNTCPAAGAVQQQPLRQAVDTTAPGASQHSRQKQQTTTAGCKAPLTDVSNTAAVAQHNLPQGEHHQQQQQPDPEAKGSCTASGPHHHKQLKQAKLPFVALPGSKPLKLKAAVVTPAAAPAVPWYKKKLQQQKEGASKATVADVAAAADGSTANELVEAGKAESPSAAQPEVVALKPSRPSAMKRAQPSAVRHQMELNAAGVAADHKSRKRVRFACTQPGQSPGHLPAKIDPEQHHAESMDFSAGAPAAATENAGTKAAAVAAVQTTDSKYPASVIEASSSHTAVSQPAILSIEDLQQSSSASSRKPEQQMCLLVPDSITRHQLQQAETLSQVANKIIVVRCGSVLLAVDQHAADERIQLELLQQAVTQQQQQQQVISTVNPACNASNKAGQSCTPQPLLQLQSLRPSQQLHLSMAEVRAVAMYQQQIERWGWRLQLNSSKAGQDSATGDKGLAGGTIGTEASAAASSNAVDTAAALQQVPVIAGVQLGALDLKLYLHQLLETAGSLSQPPPGVVRTLKSKACRSAIMFGDELTQQQAVQLVQKLAQTRLCFCCAHGRPTTAPLLDLAVLHNRMEQQASARCLANQAATAASGQVDKATEQQQKMKRLVADLRRRVKA